MCRVTDLGDPVSVRSAELMLVVCMNDSLTLASSVS